MFTTAARIGHINDFEVMIQTSQGRCTPDVYGLAPLGGCKLNKPNGLEHAFWVGSVLYKNPVQRFRTAGSDLHDVLTVATNPRCALLQARHIVFLGGGN